MGAPELTAFLSSLAVEGRVAASTQNQALSGLLFLYREVLEHDVPWLDGVVRATRPQRLPIVLTRQEVLAVLRPLKGVPRLMASLLSGSGLRRLECCRLRVQDVDFGTNQIVVRGAKGDKDRVTMLPAAIKADLAAHLDRVREQHQRDLQDGAGWVELPTALARKYPNAPREWVWQGVPRHAALPGPGHPAAAPASPARVRAPAHRQGRGTPSGNRQASDATHSAPFVRGRTCSRTAATSAPSRNCSDTAT